MLGFILLVGAVYFFFWATAIRQILYGVAARARGVKSAHRQREHGRLARLNPDLFIK